MVYRRCRALLRSDAQAEEAIQDVFVKRWTRRETLDSTALSSLLFQMATQLSLNRVRTHRRHPEGSDDTLLLEIADVSDAAGSSLAALALDRLLGREPVSSAGGRLDRSHRWRRLGQSGRGDRGPSFARVCSGNPRAE